jgi:hypothetical protein
MGFSALQEWVFLYSGGGRGWNPLPESNHFFAAMLRTVPALSSV